MAGLEIIGVARSTYVWTCRIACVEKGVPYTHTRGWPGTPEMRALHPFGKIPAMRHGDLVLYESKAICTYIDRAFPGPKLIPEELVAGALVEQWISVVNTTIDPLCIRRYLYAHVFPGTPDGGPDQAAVQAALPGLREQLEFLDRSVAPTGHLVGGAFTLADANLLPILYYLARLPEAGAIMAGLPALTHYLTHHLARPSVAATEPPPPKGK
ncbi:glutathione S-transferase family protein [Belnapia sp. T6]|uniref:glutathione transferase n=1 Tax=Belnapia mucosa TaxID=2804532 RepID=A0ABS1UXC1_9PROT|nr:glutathione S-transferase family protein [Belnapia mucosa]MBL6454105.1 glutathione S-transferase family protein [Belnapia mucosa]